GKHLIHADAAFEYGALLKGCPREDVAGLARMDADSRGVLVEQAGDDIQPGPEGRQGLQALAQLHGGAGPFGPPMVRVDAIADEQGGEALGKGGRPPGGGWFVAPYRQGSKPGKGHGHANAAEHRAPIYGRVAWFQG